MSDRSKIEWTDATWNVVTGCHKVSPGCDHCYAERITNRFGGPGAFDTVVLHPERLDKPLHWRKPRRVFVNSMADLFHPDVPDDFIAQVFAVMGSAERHTFQVLTKRPGRMASLVGSQRFLDLVGIAKWDLDEDQWIMHDRVLSWQLAPWPLRNVWLGVSVENQHWADIRIPKLLETPAAVRFLSAEPLLGHVDLAAFLGAGTGTGTGHERGPSTAAPTAPATGDGPQNQQSNGGRRAPSSPPAGGGNAAGPGSARAWPGPSIDWVICGGESGPEARPMHPGWARSLRDHCVAAGVPFFAKQGSGPRSGHQYDLPDDVWAYKEMPSAHL